jgi:hypothetical protein
LERIEPLESCSLARAATPIKERGSVMSSTLSNEMDEFGDEFGNQGRGSTRAMWTQRRQAKQRTRAKAKRTSASMAAQKGMHMRRNKRMGW